MPFQDFYQTLAQISFTLFGLWIVVVQLHREQWRETRQAAAGARLLTMHYALPGVMSLLAMADPGGAVLWRISFAALALAGGLGFVLVAGRAGGADPEGWAAMTVYVAIAVVALFVGEGAAVLSVDALQVEAVLLSLLVLLSLNSTFRLLFGAEPGGGA